MRVLHLVDPASAGGGACTLFLLAEAVHRLNSIEHLVVVVGNRRRTDLARRCGLPVSAQISPPLGMPLLARQQLKSLLRLLRRSGHTPDIVHSWTADSALLAASVLRHQRMLATCTVGPMPGPAAGLYAAIVRRRSLPMLVTSTGVLDEYVARGFDRACMSLLPPAVNPMSVHMTPRAALRRRWGIDENTFLVGLLSDPWSWADAHGAADILARLASAGRRIRLLVHHRAFRRVEAERWVRQLGWSDFIMTDDEVAEPWKIVNGIDAALFVGTTLSTLDSRSQISPMDVVTGGSGRARPLPGTMPLLWAMSAEVPVVAEASAAVQHVVEDGHNGLLINQGDRVGAADRFIRLYDDRALARRLGGAALETIQQRFDISAYAVRLRGVYENLMHGRPPSAIDASEHPQVARYEPESETWTTR